VLQVDIAEKTDKISALKELGFQFYQAKKNKRIDGRRSLIKR
jgi:hypothetical protein